MSFLKPEEIQDWDIVANHYDEIDNISEEQKAKAKKAFLFLKAELGKNYLKGVDTNHPIYFNIVNHVVSSRLWFIDLAADIKRLKEFPSYKFLHNRIKKPKKFPEAFSVLEIAIKYCKAGFNIEFDPKVLIREKIKVPDLKVINSTTSELFYCEVSVLNVSEIEKKAGKTELELFKAVIFPPFLEFSGIVERILTDEEIKEIIYRIKEVKKRVSEQEGFGELIIKGTITLGLATEENKDKLIDWAKLHNCEVGNFIPPYFVSNEIRRMKSKINEKRKQLPFNRSNLIMIYDNDFFYTCGNIFQAINEIESTISNYKDINGVIIRGKVTTKIKPINVAIKENIIFVQKYQYNTFAEQYLILWNKNSNVPLTNETTTRIIDSIIRY